MKHRLQALHQAWENTKSPCHTPESPKLSVFDLSLRKQRRSLHNSLQLLHPLNFPFETSQLGVYLGRVGWEVWFHSSSSWDLKAAEKAQQSEKEAAAAAAAAQSEKEAQQANAMAALINAARHAVGIGVDHDHLNNINRIPCLLMRCEGRRFQIFLLHQMRPRFGPDEFKELEVDSMP